MHEENIAYYSIKEFAKLIRVHEQTVRNSIRSGRIQAFRVGNGKKSAFRIPASEVSRIALFDMKDLVKQIMENEKKIED